MLKWPKRGNLQSTGLALGVRLYSLSGQGTCGSRSRRLLLTSGPIGKQKGDRTWVQDKDLKAHPQQLTS